MKQMSFTEYEWITGIPSRYSFITLFLLIEVLGSGCLENCGSINLKELANLQDDCGFNLLFVSSNTKDCMLTNTVP